MNSEELKGIVNGLLMEKIDELVRKERIDNDCNGNDTKKEIERLEEALTCLNYCFNRYWMYERTK
jgi:hypothetical protein